MSFRNVIVNERCKLEYSLNYLICKKRLDETRILIDEIKLVIINSTQVSITTSLISMLSKNKIKLIFCDERHNPECELVPYQNNYYSYRKIKDQIKFIENKGNFWKRIVEEKIYNQARNLKIINCIDEYEMLEEYKNNVLEGDSSNREGHSAKVYFNAIFGKGFSRDSDNVTNKYLNYGYSIILSSINREIKFLGYLTELGIHHIGESNPFNFSCDLMEPIRPLIDSYVIKKMVNEDNYKTIFIDMLASEVIFNNQKILLDNAIHLYIMNAVSCIKDNDIENIKFIEYEL